MSYTSEIGPTTLVLTFEGETSDAEVKRSYQEAAKHPDFRPGLQLLVHDRGTSFNPRKEDMIGLIVLFRRMGLTRAALVVERTLHRGLARQMEVFCEDEGFPLRSFRTKEEAWEWLEGHPDSGH